MLEQETEQETMTLEDLARKYKVSTRTIQRRIENKKLLVTPVSGRYRIDTTTKDDNQVTQVDDKEMTPQMFIKVVSHLLLNEKVIIQGQTVLLRSLVNLLDSDFDFIEQRLQDIEQRVKALESGKDK